MVTRSGFPEPQAYMCLFLSICPSAFGSIIASGKLVKDILGVQSHIHYTMGVHMNSDNAFWNRFKKLSVRPLLSKSAEPLTPL